MAHPVVRKRITQMLTFKKRSELSKDSKVLESMAQQGNPMALKVIQMSNESKMKDLEKMQQQMKDQDQDAT